MEVNLSCRHFPGDRPCRYHKEAGSQCHGCPHFAPTGFRVLIIKLDALGDVLRTTCLLPSLKRRYSDAHVSWLTSSSAAKVLQNNPYLDDILVFDAEGLARLQVEHFELVLNPDASKHSAALASLAHGRTKRGFALDNRGRVRPLNSEAVQWMEIGARDDLKRANRQTYQEHVHRICGLDPAGQQIVLRLTEGERVQAQRIASQCGVEAGSRLVAFNTGSSARWPRKRWPRERFLDLALLLRKTTDCRVLLVGGPLERETNRWLARKTEGWAVDTGCDHAVREYFALIGLCEVLVTGDTLGLHAALGLEKKVVALFGPTSPWEVDLYGRGVRIVPDLDCVCCYRNKCEVSPGCMDLITPQMVLEAVEGLLSHGEGSRDKAAAQAPALAGAR